MADIVIVGGGIIGGSILYYLYKNGFDGKITVIEKNNQLAQASTSLSAGGVRNIWSTKINLLLTNYSINAFKNFKEELGENIGFEQIGYLFTFYEKDWQKVLDFVPEWKKYNVRVDIVKPEEIKNFVPNFKYGIKHISEEENEFLNMEEIAGGIFGPDCGSFNPTTAATAYFDYTKKKYSNKVDIKLNANVEKIIFENNIAKGVMLSNGEKIMSDIVIIAAGAWSGDLLKKSIDNENYHIPVVPWKRQLFTVRMPNIPGFEKIPMTIIDNGVYFKPEAGNLLVGRADTEQSFGYDITPDVNYYQESMNYYMAARIPGMEYCRIISKASIWGGLYAHNTKDKNALIGYHPDLNNLFLATGFSGHGVMEAPAVGMSVSEKILFNEYKTIPETEALSFERIKNNKLIKETIVI